MNLVRNIKINDKHFSLDISKNYGHGYSGSIYLLRDNDRELAIKLYRNEPEFEEEEQDEWFPPVEMLEKFNYLADSVYPFLLSQSKVLDENNKYIGCCSYYVTETRGDTKKIVFDLPRDKFFSDFFSLIEQVSFISKNHICLDDISLNNMKYGTISKFPNVERIYSFDDSNYFICDREVKQISYVNYKIFNDFMIEIILDYYNDYIYTEQQYNQFVSNLNRYTNNFINVARKCKNAFEYLEHESRGYPNMNEFLIDRGKKYIK